MTPPLPLEELFARCLQFSEERGLLKKMQGGALVAFSGGADSVFLLLFARWLSEKLGFPVGALHVNHGIRGEEAMRDEEFCRKFCLENNVDFRSVFVNVPALAKEEGAGTEATARKHRYAALEKEREACGFSAVLTAHTASDRAETVLLNLLRGCGNRGLCGIPAVRGCVLRPLLELTGEEIRAGLQGAGVSFVEDSTNADSTYRRNYLRNEVFPLLSQITPSPQLAICRAAEHARLDESFFSWRVACLRKEAVTDGALLRDPLIAEHDAVAIRLLADFCAEDAPMGIYPEEIHLQKAMALLRSGKANFRMNLPGGRELVCERDRIFIADERENGGAFCIPLQLGENLLPDGSILVVGTNQNNDKTFSRNVYKLSTRAKLPFDTIKGVVARSRRAADSVYVRGHRHKLKKLFTERKIPLSMRDKLPVLEDKEGILWVPFVEKSDRGQAVSTTTVTYYCAKQKTTGEDT